MSTLIRQDVALPSDAFLVFLFDGDDYFVRLLEWKNGRREFTTPKVKVTMQQLVDLCNVTLTRVPLKFKGLTLIGEGDDLAVSTPNREPVKVIRTEVRNKVWRLLGQAEQVQTIAMRQRQPVPSARPGAS